MKHLLICELDVLQEAADLCRANGFGVEIQPFYHPAALENPELIEKIIRVVDGIAVKSMHGPFGDLCPGSFDSEVRALAARRFEQAWQVARQLDVAHVVFHHGYFPHTSLPSGWLKRWPAFWKDFLRDKADNIRIHIENHLDPTPDLISEAVAAVEKDTFDIALDIGHTHFASKIPVPDWIEKLGSQIGYVHFHDNHGEEDEHLGLGKGTMPMVEVCRALEEYAPDAIWAIESKPEDIMLSLEWLVEHGFLKNKIIR
jgi:sugar phosphate isomerase/epimerase